MKCSNANKKLKIMGRKLFEYYAPFNGQMPMSIDRIFVVNNKM